MYKFWAMIVLILNLLSVAACGDTGTLIGYDTPPQPQVVSTPPTGILTEWLTAHRNVAQAIVWQFRAADAFNAYIPPAQSDKIAWPAWSKAQQNDLNTAFLNASAWFAQGTPAVTMPHQGLTDEPLNQHPQTNIDSLSVLQNVSPDYMWNLYISEVAFALAQEINHPLPWSLASYSTESLRYLFDSSTLAWQLNLSTSGNVYTLGTYGGANLPQLRANTLPQTAFASPLWVYGFLRQSGLIGSTRRETIGLVMDWMRSNMAHFYGPETFGNFEAVWQYRGFSPLSKIVNGTIDANNPNEGVQHWTAGCHGSVGFLNAVLRALNIPVQPVWVCGHELAYFPTESLYLDHGDNPYNGTVRAAPNRPILSLLIDESTYQSWFTTDLTKNILDDTSPACDNVGRRAREF